MYPASECIMQSRAEFIPLRLYFTLHSIPNTQKIQTFDILAFNIE